MKHRAVAGLALVLLAIAPARAQFTAASASPFTVGSAPKSVALGDFNADGKLDIAAANSNDNNVTILFGNGAGGFTAAVGSPFAVGAGPQALAVADFNGDGKPDLVTANGGGNSVSVLLNNGAGGFVAAVGSPFAVGAAPAFVAVGDFNGDGKPDIVTADSGGNTVTVLLGNGAGGFAAAAGSPFAVGLSPSAVIVGDLNRDGKQDLVVANAAGNSVTVLLGDGLGGFAAAGGSPVAAGLSPSGVALGDWNGDGLLDLAIANAGDNTLTVLVGDGMGGFAAAVGSPVAAGSGPCGVWAFDFNGDGNQDLAVADCGGNGVIVLAGDGTGGFTASAGSPFAAGAAASWVAVGDFNGDGKPDLAVAESGSGAVAILLNSLPAITARLPALTFYAGAGQGAPASIPVSVSSAATGSTYTAMSSVPWLAVSPASHATGGASTVNFSASAASLAAGVYTGAVRFAASGFFDDVTSVTFHVATVSGTLAASAGSPFAAGGSPQSIAVADFNGDGIPDMVAADFSGNGATVLLGDGMGGVTAALFAAGTNPSSVAVGDFNGDGKLDIAIANSVSNDVTVLLGDGMGGFAAAAGSPYAVGVAPLAIAVGDFNGDGRTDVVVANSTGRSLTVLLGDGTGGFAAAGPFALGRPPSSVAVGDVNSDGKQDLVAATTDGEAAVLYGDGAGGFGGLRVFAAGSIPQAVALADLNHDGNLDIVTANSGDNTVGVLLGDGAGGFNRAAGSPFAVGRTPQAVAVADVNGDGKPDIAAANAGDNTVTILRGDGAGGFAAASGSPFAAGTTPVALAVADFDGDGRQDLAVANIGGSAVTVLAGSLAATSAALRTTASNPVTFGSAVPLSLTVALAAGGFYPPTGSVTFLDGGGAIGMSAQTTSPYSFSATGLASGSHTITATFAGDASSAASTSNAITLTVAPANQTIAFVAPAGRPFGPTPVTVSATASSGLAVSFDSNTPLVCTVSGTAVTLLATGSCTIEASQAGDGDYNAAPVVDRSFTVTKASQTITFDVVPAVVVGSSPFTINATASSGLSVAFASTSATVCRVSGSLVAPIGAGTCAIQATQAGDTNYTAAPSVTQRFAVTPSSQAITFGPLVDQPFGTAPFTLNATASSGLTVTFASSTASVCTVSGATVTLVAGGTCTIRASQAGSGAYAAAPAVTQQFSVTPAAQTISFGALADKPFGAAPFTLSATASSNLTVAFASLTLPVCTVAAKTVTLVSVGTCTIGASQAGNGSYAAATPVSESFNVTQAPQTITFGALSRKALGAPDFTVSATASSGLVVAFVSTTPSVCTVAGNSVTLIGAGTCTIEASQAGNAGYASATVVDQSFAVTPQAQTITFAALANQGFGSLPFTVSATASSSLTVSFASTTSAICTVAGATVTLVSAGTCTIVASQAGDINDAAAATVSRSFMVTLGSQTISFGALADQIFGISPFDLGATATSGLTVSFASATATVCKVSGVSVTLSGVGICTLQATQTGNRNYSAAPSVSQSFRVQQGNQSIGFALLPDQVIGAAPFMIRAAASSGLTVTFASLAESVCRVSVTTVTLLGAGVCTIMASQPGNANYAAASPVVQAFTVGAGVVAIASVLNSGSYAADALVSDAISVVFGTNFATTTAQAKTLPLPVALAGTTVTITDSSGAGTNAQLFYVSPMQINFLVPEGLAMGDATVTVSNAAGATGSFAATTAQIAPSLYTADSSGTGPPAAIALSYANGAAGKVVPIFHCAGTPTACTPTAIDLGAATTSVYLELFGTGIRGQTDLSQVSATLGGVALQVTYAGAQASDPGLDQVNVLLDRSLIGQGAVTLQLSVGGVQANPVTVSIK